MAAFAVRSMLPAAVLERLRGTGFAHGFAGRCRNMPKQTTADIIARQEWLEPVAKALQGAVRKAFEAGGSTGQHIKDVLHGVWLGDPLHAALTDVPLGAWTAAIVMDIADTIKANDRLAAGADAAVGVGLAGAAAAAITGLTDWQHVGGAPRRVGVVHGLLNLSSAALFATSFVLRTRQSRRVAKVAAAAGYVVSLAAARLGGALVYRHRIGVDHAPEDRGPHVFTPVLAETELRDGQPTRADLNGVPIVLVRSGTHVFALAEACSHLGGPLSEGKYQNGVIQCPWHGSQFSVVDGRVVHGPSVHPQVCFEARIREGQIEVRRYVESPRKGFEPREEAA
jgi:nitrite reductase/ring-hydroxylating ferredoxin subunit/uncharacterized membrane protein/ribosome modulation factor